MHQMSNHLLPEYIQRNPLLKITYVFKLEMLGYKKKKINQILDRII